MASYGAGGKYPEETNPSSGGEKRDEYYPRGKTAKLPHGTPASHVPGSTDARSGSHTKTRTAPESPPRCADHCADDMDAIVPGAKIGRNRPYKK